MFVSFCWEILTNTQLIDFTMSYILMSVFVVIFNLPFHYIVPSRNSIHQMYVRGFK